MPKVDEPSIKPVSQKLGGKPGLKVCSIGEPSKSKLGRQLIAAIGKAGRFSAFKDLEAFRRWRFESWDLVIAWVEDRQQLDSILSETRGRIAPHGAVWTVIPNTASFPKGTAPTIAQGDIFAAPPRAGLVDVKQAKIS
ncbi:MAG: hypothetical protein HYZ68_00950, partial [Chloroflexi bacterium]|nr:hypothetical protein [Chloroflexota bacterium]